MKLSLIIPTCNEPVALWFTAMGALSQLNTLGVEYETLVGNNGKDNITIGKLKDFGFSIYDVPGRSTSTVRNVPAKHAKGEILCFADTHVVFGEGFFRKALSRMDSDPSMGALFGFATMDKGSLFSHYLIKDTLFHSFNAVHAHLGADVPVLPYRAAVAGHGVWFVRREAFERIGGYLDEQESWGGEEVGTCLLLGMYGYSLYVDPSMHHWHLPTSYRTVSRDFTKNTANHLMAAYVCGGPVWFERSRKHYSKYEDVSKESISPSTIVSAVGHRRKAVESGAVRTLEQLLEDYRNEGVAH